MQIKRHPESGELAVLCRRSDGMTEDASFYSLDHFLQAALVVETTVTEIKRHLAGLAPSDP